MGGGNPTDVEAALEAWQARPMLSKLPGWVVGNAESVRREAERYRGMPAAEKLELVAGACRTAARLLEASPNRDRALAHVEPLPPESIAALDRLRRSYRAARRAREP